MRQQNPLKFPDSSAAPNDGPKFTLHLFYADMSNTKPNSPLDGKYSLPANLAFSVPLDFLLTLAHASDQRKTKFNIHTTERGGNFGAPLTLSRPALLHKVLIRLSGPVSAPLEQGTVMQPCTPSAPCCSLCWSTSPQNAPKRFHLDAYALGPTAKPRLPIPNICAGRRKHRRSALISGRMHPVIGRARHLRHVRGMVRPRIAGQKRPMCPKNPLKNLAQKI
jgi:hypothetical protein